MRSLIVLLFFSFVFNLGFAQDYALSNIPKDLFKGVYAITQEDYTKVLLEDYDKMIVTHKEVVSIVHPEAMEHLSFGVGYDSHEKVKSIQAIIYDAKGNEVKKIKKKEFFDVSAAGGNLYSDDRAYVLDFTPTFYPFTILFEYEMESENTAWLPRYFPLRDDEVSIVESKYIIENPKKLPLKKRILNFQEYGIQFSENETTTTTTTTIYAQNLKPIKFEVMAPRPKTYLPWAGFVPEKFKLGGVSATVKDWNDFNSWQLEKLLQGMDEIPLATISKVKNLVQDLEDPKEKAKRIYEFVQNKTRYISIQIGIGGWKPMPANQVDEVGYGDCKALTNYTKALLASQGIESYYTIVEALPGGIDLDEEFVALQGNHVILSIPFEEETVFLECTSQSIPFSFLGTHTDDRKVLMITPEGPVFDRTPTYTAADNLKQTKANLTITSSLSLEGSVSITSRGLAYDKIYEIETLNSQKLNDHYKEYFDFHTAFSIDEANLQNNKETIEFIEEVDFKSKNYISKAGDKLLFAPNVFTRWEFVPRKYQNRKQDFEVRRGYSFEDTIEIAIPEQFQIESIFEPYTLESEFGSYQVSVLFDRDANTIVYHRKFHYNAGVWAPDKYKDFISFCKTIKKKDQSKIIITTK